MSIDFQLRMQIGTDEPKIIETGSREHIIKKRKEFLKELPEADRNNKNIRIWMTAEPAKMKTNDYVL